MVLFPIHHESLDLGVNILARGIRVSLTLSGTNSPIGKSCRAQSAQNISIYCKNMHIMRYMLTHLSNNIDKAWRVDTFGNEFRSYIPSAVRR